MNDSLINPTLLSSSVYLKNVEQLIQNLEKQTVNIDNFEDILNDHNRQEIITKSFSSNTISNNDLSDDNFLIKSIKFPSNNIVNSFLIQSDDQLASNININSSGSSTSWRQMKESQRVTTDIPSKEIQSSSPIKLYKIFQQKSITSDRQLNNLKFDHDSTTTRKNLSSLHKSLPDLSFISKYSKEIPRSLTTSPISSSSININRTTPSPILIQQQKQDTDRPRTLKSIKRYKNSKHSTEPLNTFYSPQLNKISNNISKQQKSCLSYHDLTKENQIKQSVNITKHFLSPCNPQTKSNTHVSRSIKRYGNMRRCQTDIIVVDPILQHYSLTDSPPNEFCLQQDENEQSYINLDEPVPLTDQSFITMNTQIPDYLSQKISDIVKRLFEIKQSEKTFFLNNEHNSQLDCLLKIDLCSAIQNILEHGRKDQKKINLWKIIQISIEENLSSSKPVPQVYCEAKQIAQNISPYWLYKFQAFIFILLNKNELINWLYYFTRQKDIIQRYYQSPDALILVSISSTFNLFERIMTQLEKLTSLNFHLIYHPPLNTEQFNTRDWVMTLSKRTSKNFIPNETFRSTLTRKLNSIFTKTNLSNDSTKDNNLTIPRQSLNVDKPKSVRYRPTTIHSK